MIPQAPQRSRRTHRMAAGLALAVLFLAGCTAEQQRGFMPGHDAGQVTNQTERITNFWVGSWSVLVLVGLMIWGLTIWCAIAYRRRKNDTGFPIQLRYHVPLELMFTLLPVVMVLTLFYFTQRDVGEIERHAAEPDAVIEIVGKQWSWDFNYLSDDVHEPAGVQSFATGEEGAADSLPVLYLPVDQNIEFRLESRDVNHAFWVVDFLYKKDVIPGFTNTFQVTPTLEGTYAGKCAELCGEYHSDMLFNVEVVSQEEFESHMQELADQGNTGQLGVDLNRNQEEWSMREAHDEAGPRVREEADQ